MERGSWLERPLLGQYAEIVGATLEFPSTVVHAKYPWIMDTADAIATYQTDGHRRAVEAKTTDQWYFDSCGEWGEEGTDQINSMYIPQCQNHMGVYGLELCDVPVWDNRKIRIYTVQYDHELYMHLVEIAREFVYNHLIPGIPPPVEGTKLCLDYLKRRPLEKKTIVDIVEPDQEKLLYEYAAICALIKEANRRKDNMEAKIRYLCDTNYGLQSEDVKLTFSKPYCTKIVDWHAVLKEAKIPETIVEKHTRYGKPTRKITTKCFADLPMAKALPGDP